LPRQLVPSAEVERCDDGIDLGLYVVPGGLLRIAEVLPYLPADGEPLAGKEALERGFRVIGGRSALRPVVIRVNQ